MTTKVAGRIATAGVVLALTTIGSRAEEIQLPTFDVVATTPLGGGEINVSQSPFAVWQTNSQDIQTFNDTTLPDALAPLGAGRHRRQRLRQRVRARPLLSWFRRDRGHRHAARAGRLSERHAHQRGVRRHRQLGPHPGKCDRQDDDHRRKPDLRPQRARRRGQRDDEERLHLAGRRSRSHRRLILARARGNSVRQAGRQLVGLYGGQSNQRRRLAGRPKRRSSPTSTATSATRRTGLSRTCNSPRGTPSSASLPSRRSSSCRRIGAASTPFPRRPITRWPCSSGPAATPIRPR